jgi:hypothetical protein
VEVPPVLKGGYRENQLVEMLLQRPQLIKHPQELEDGYIWQRLIMVRQGGVCMLCSVMFGFIEADRHPQKLENSHI